MSSKQIYKQRRGRVGADAVDHAKSDALVADVFCCRFFADDTQIDVPIGSKDSSLEPEGWILHERNLKGTYYTTRCECD